MREAAHLHVPLTVMSVHPAPVRPATQIYWNVPDLPDRSFDPGITRMGLRKMVDEVAESLGETPPEVVVNVITGVGRPGRLTGRSCRDPAFVLMTRDERRN